MTHYRGFAQVAEWGLVALLAALRKADRAAFGDHRKATCA